MKKEENEEIMKKTTSLTFGVGVVGQKEQRKSKNNRSWKKRGITMYLPDFRSRGCTQKKWSKNKIKK